MKTTSAARRGLYGVFAACLSGGAAAAAMARPSATAANDPCAANEIARTIGSVATNTGNYLDSHPSTNTALTAAAEQQGGDPVAADGPGWEVQAAGHASAAAADGAGRPQRRRTSGGSAVGAERDGSCGQRPGAGTRGDRHTAGRGHCPLTRPAAVTSVSGAVFSNWFDARQESADQFCLASQCR